MAFPITLGDCIEVRIETSLAGQRMFNVLHYSVTNIGTSPITNGNLWLSELGAFIATDPSSVVVRMRARMSQDASVVRVYTQKILTPRFRSVTTTVTGGVGGIPQTSSPPNVARTISKLSEIATRGATGSFHLAGIPQDDYTAGVFTPAVVAGDGLLQIAIQADITPVANQATITPIILQRRPTIAYKNFAGMETQPTVRVMRRRTVGVGI